MIPLKDLHPTRTVPFVNRLLLLGNLALWLYVVTLDRVSVDAFFARYSFDWTTFAASVETGDLSPVTLAPILTHQFLHAGWLHVLGNLLYLWIFGDRVEDRLGHARYLAFYLLAGVAAAVGQGLLAPGPMVGASGAIAGVLGAYLILSPTAGIRTLVFLGIFITVVTLPAFVVVGLWIVLQVLAGLEGLRVTTTTSAESVAYAAHVSGALFGIVVMLLIGDRRSRRSGLS